jgi:uncharacterized hydrophobic protein (TIGR00271 family)
MPRNDTHMEQGSVRYSRELGRRVLTTLGVSVSIGVLLYTLLGPLTTLAGGESLVQTFVLMGVISVLIVLTYSERIGVIPGSGGPYNLARMSRFLWLEFFTGWLLAGGYVSLGALLSYGASIYVDIILRQFLVFEIELRWLSLAVLLFVAITQALGRGLKWWSRLTLVGGSMLVVLLLSIRAVFLPGEGEGISSFFVPIADTTTLATLSMSSLWGLVFIMNLRDHTRRPPRNLLPSMLYTVAITVGLGCLAAVAVSLNHGYLLRSLTPLLDISTGMNLLPQPIINLIYAAFGLGITLIGLYLTINHGLNHFDELTKDGFLPPRLANSKRRAWLPSGKLLAFVIITGICLIIGSPVIFAGLSALTFLWSTALSLAPDILNAKPDLPEKRNPKLPFHPLFPGLTVAVGTLMPFTLQPKIWAGGLIWLVAGVVTYISYSRGKGIEARREVIVVDEVRDVERRSRYRVMLGLREDDDIEGLIQTGAAIARARDGELLVLKPVVESERTPTNIRVQEAKDAWEELNQMIAGLAPGMEVKPVVRLASSVASGILGAVGEEDIDLVLIGWEGELKPAEPFEDDLINELFRNAACDVVVSRGTLRAPIKRISVSTSGGLHAPFALELGRELVDPEGEIQLFTVVPNNPDEERMAQAEAVLEETLRGAGGADGVQTQVVRAFRVEDGLLSQAEGVDLFIIGASREGVLDRSFFGGIPTRVAAKSDSPALITRAQEKANLLVLQRAWGFFTDFLPDLSRQRKREVVKDLEATAVPSVDFYVLIVLSAAIASLGLMQDSAAVIIGAMLVAPLMSPILAMGMSVVQGDLRTLGNASEAVIKGATMAIVMGIVMVIISPIDEPTREILARTQPTVLDLLVAVFGGLAAGYALCREEVSAAMPGVAISAALVPPLCVVGYGIGMAEFTLALGALLLFITNLVAILFAAAVMYLALGFTPPRAERREFIKNLETSIASLVAVAGVLLFMTLSTLNRAKKLSEVEDFFVSELLARAGRIESIDIQKREGGYTIDALILSYPDTELDSEALSQLDQAIEEAIGSDVVINATILQAELGEFTVSEVGQQRALREIFEERVRALGVVVVQLETSVQEGGYLLNATVIETSAEITSEFLSGLKADMEDSVGAQVQIELVKIEGMLENTR